MVRRLPPDLVARALDLARGGPWQPPEPVDASTVVLLRDTLGAVEVLLMRRPATMSFAPGMHVFPGGRVDRAQDWQPDVEGRTGLAQTRSGLGRALTVAAVRETFEEAGVLLAVDRRGDPPSPDRHWAADRRASELSRSFPGVLARRRLTIRARHLVPIAHWITPEVESRRYDTRFLAAALPAGQEVDPHATEAESARWITPGDALDEHRRGSLPMLPPTVAVLRQIAGRRAVPEVLAAAAGTDVTPLMPRAVLSGDTLEWVIVNPYTGRVLGPGTEPAASEQRGAD